MVKSDQLRLLIAAAAAALLSIAAAAAASGEDFGWIPMKNPATCRGSMGECMADVAGEFEMDSEINRRVLATRRTYISYGALVPNQTPCSRRGSSYYNCRAGAQANAYQRSCSTITSVESFKRFIIFSQFFGYRSHVCLLVPPPLKAAGGLLGGIGVRRQLRLAGLSQLSKNETIDFIKRNVS
ncbi:rapid alkalinization factor, partial [Striga asiatica]